MPVSAVSVVVVVLVDVAVVDGTVGVVVSVIVSPLHPMRKTVAAKCLMRIVCCFLCLNMAGFER